MYIKLCSDYLYISWSSCNPSSAFFLKFDIFLNNFEIIYRKGNRRNRADLSQYKFESPFCSIQSRRTHLMILPPEKKKDIPIFVWILKYQICCCGSVYISFFRLSNWPITKQLTYNKNRQNVMWFYQKSYRSVVVLIFLYSGSPFARHDTERKDKIWINYPKS